MGKTLAMESRKELGEFFNIERVQDPETRKERKRIIRNTANSLKVVRRPSIHAPWV